VAELGRRGESVAAGHRWPVPQAAAIVSVNPPAAREVFSILERQWRLRPLLAGRELRVTMPIRTRNAAVGQDRLCSAEAAYDRVGGACIVVGCGTALTVDAVSDGGAFLGGAITCGLELAAMSLHEHTALVPRVKLSRPRHVIGRDTAAAVRSGVTLGAAGAVERLVHDVRAELGCRATVLATGGNAKALGRATGCFDRIVPGLVLEGVRLLYERHVAEREAEH